MKPDKDWLWPAAIAAPTAARSTSRSGRHWRSTRPAGRTASTRRAFCCAARSLAPFTPLQRGFSSPAIGALRVPVCDVSIHHRQRLPGLAFPQQHDLAVASKFIEIVSPRLHHLDALWPKFGSMHVSVPNIVQFLVCKLTLDGVGSSPFARRCQFAARRVPTRYFSGAYISIVVKARAIAS